MAANGTTGTLSDAVGYVREGVRAMKAYAPGEQKTGCIKLNTNECAWGPAPAVLKAICSVTEDQLRLYPSPLCDKVRQAAALYNAAREVGPDGELTVDAHVAKASLRTCTRNKKRFLGIYN